MFIPKSKMPRIISILGFVLDEHPKSDELFSEEDLELVRQIHDRATLCQHGDGTGLDINVRYAPAPSYITRGLCSNCGSNLVNGTCFSC
jgi:hypothetical protein